MRKYCLTYDAKDSSKWLPDELKLDIAKLLIENGADNLQSLLASTITFEDLTDKNRITVWNNLINQNKSEDIYFYLCLIAQNKDTKENIDRIEGDIELNQRFRNLLKIL